VVQAMHTSQIQKKNLFKNPKIEDIITFGEQSLDLFFVAALSHFSSNRCCFCSDLK